MSSYPAYISDLEHARLNAHVFPGYVVGTHLVPNPKKGLRQDVKTKVWKVEQKLGKGGSGEVRLEVHREEDTAENERRAVKRIWTSGSNLRKEYERELKALLEFSKPKYKEAGVFVEFLGWFEDRDSVYITMEYVPLGDLEDNIPPKGDAINELDIREIASQILEGLKFMHQEAFIHRDLKPKNVLVCRRQPQWWIKLADFGLSKRKTEETAYRTHTGTQAYMAPEVLNYVPGIDPQSSGYTNAIDLWGLGCIIYRLASGVVPFPVGPSLYQYCVKQLAFPSHSLPLSLSGTNFTMNLLQPYPSSRPTAIQALNHIWMTATIDSENQLPASPHAVLCSAGRYDTGTHPALRSKDPAFENSHPSNCFLGGQRHPPSVHNPFRTNILTTLKAEPHHHPSDGELFVLGVATLFCQFACRGLISSNSPVVPRQNCYATFDTAEELETHFLREHFRFTRASPFHQYLCAFCKRRESIPVNYCAECGSMGLCCTQICGYIPPESRHLKLELQSPWNEIVIPN